MRWPAPLLRLLYSMSEYRCSSGTDRRHGPIDDDVLPLLARLSVGMIFWRSGQTKLDGWHVADNAVYLFQTEYRLPFIDPWMAASLSAFNENVFSVLLVVGLATRVAALVLLGTTLVIEVFVYPDAWPIHGTWAVCLVLVLVRGAGVVSLDHLIAWRRRWARRGSPPIGTSPSRDPAAARSAPPGLPLDTATREKVGYTVFGLEMPRSTQTAVQPAPDLKC